MVTVRARGDEQKDAAVFIEYENIISLVKIVSLALIFRDELIWFEDRT